MAANFVLTTAARLAAPVMSGASFEEKDQAPTGGWVEVTFAATTVASPMQTRDQVVHISTDVALRFKVSPTQPAVEIVGCQMLAGAERTIGFAVGERLWIK